MRTQASQRCRLSFHLRRRFIPIAGRDIHISGPYCSARADESTPHQWSCPSQHRRSHVSRAHRARGFPFRQRS
ncbi:hypothetical protein DF154_19485 [Burkholderia ubonensis]|nr:hypothetical protein DF154_19485 [Burkholderia ubonensis]